MSKARLYPLQFIWELYTRVTPQNLPNTCGERPLFLLPDSLFCSCSPIGIQSPYVRGWWGGGSNHPKQNAKKYGVPWNPFFGGEQGSDRGNKFCIQLFVRHESRLSKPSTGSSRAEHRALDHGRFVAFLWYGILGAMNPCKNTWASQSLPDSGSDHMLKKHSWVKGYAGTHFFHEQFLRKT